jgi:hypothetical protein
MRRPTISVPGMTFSRKHLFLHWIPALIGIAVILGKSTPPCKAENTSRWLFSL